jgi:hypothetical protein
MSDSSNAVRVPSRGVMARRWPKLRINRMTGRWHDEATGARGDNIESLLAYLKRRKAD